MKIEPTDTLNLRSERQKVLFHGYFKSRWGKAMSYDVPTPKGTTTESVFNKIYNEGIKLFSEGKVTITCERMEKFLCIMRDTYFPGRKPNENAILPRVFSVCTEYSQDPSKGTVMSIAQVSKTWKWATPIIERSDFVAMQVEFTTDEFIAIEKLPEITI